MNTTDDLICEDILHEALASAFDALDDLNDKRRLEAWFHQILRNRAMDFHREYLGNQKWAHRRKGVFVPEFQSNHCRCIHDVIPTSRRPAGLRY